MRELLRRVAAKFSKPAARIVVTSYYLILSDQGRFGLRNEFLLTMGVPIASLATLFPAAGDARVRFAAPPFTAANAALAADPWLFGVRWDLSPQDPVAAARREACTSRAGPAAARAVLPRVGRPPECRRGAAVCGRDYRGAGVAGARGRSRAIARTGLLSCPCRNT